MAQPPAETPAMDHHVYFWLKDECKDAAARAEFEQGLASLFEIDLVAGGRWSVPAPVMLRPVIDQSWDYALTMRFDTVEQHDTYQVHDLHHAFIEAHKFRWAKVLVMDLA
ncbi:MAG: Dabb family protein [Akkermansiaceae bacterium]|nr:Dabb family protein [Akkermansiaceae bacterium]